MSVAGCLMDTQASLFTGGDPFSCCRGQSDSSERNLVQKCQIHQYYNDEYYSKWVPLEL